MAMTITDAALQDQSIDRFIRRVAILYSIRYTLLFCSIWGFLSGAVILSIRAITGETHLELIWLVTGILPCAAIALLLSLRRLPDRSAVRAFLDHRSGCGGLFMASERAELGEWKARMPALAEPRPRWRARRSATLALASVVFASISFLVPTPSNGSAPDRSLDIAKEVQAIASDIDLLKKEEIINPSQAETLETKLDSLSAEARGEDPAKTWEALDHLQNEVSKTAEESAEQLARRNEQLAQAQALSEALAEAGSGIDSKLMTEAMKELQAQMQGAAGKEKNGQAIPEDLLKALKSGSLTKEQLKQLADALKLSKGGIARQLTKLHDARLIDLKTLKQCEKGGQCDSAGLAQFLSENSANMSVTEMMERWGRGGVDRGRADAPMTWADRSSERGAKFKEQILPSSTAGLKDSELVGRSSGAPEIEKAGPHQGGALKTAVAGGGSAFTQTVLPRHRAAVNRYFERR